MYVDIKFKTLDYYSTYYRKLHKRNKDSLLSRSAPQINSTELDLRNPEQAGKWESTGIMLGC